MDILEIDKQKLLYSLPGFSIIWVDHKEESNFNLMKKNVESYIDTLDLSIYYYKKYFDESEINNIISKIHKKIDIENICKNVKNKKYIYDLYKTIFKSYICETEEEKDKKIPYYEDYEVYQFLINKFKSIKTITDYTNLLLQKIFIYLQNSTICMIPQNTFICKGVKYFYSTQDEIQFHQNVKYGYYGDQYIGLKYAIRYSGGLQVYQAKRDLKLLNITNDTNIRYILSLVDENSKTIFFRNITYQYFVYCMKMKYGVNINKYYQAYCICKYLDYQNEMWLKKPSQNDYIKDENYSGWYFGHGYIDRVCVEGIMNLIQKEGYDGVTCIAGYYTPYMDVTQNEVILWNQDENLRRCEEHILDSTQFMKTLPFDIQNMKINENILHMNHQFKYNLYYKNYFFNHQKVINIEYDVSKIHMMSYNLQNYEVINLYDSPILIFNNILNMIELNKIDICVLYEAYVPYVVENIKYSKYKMIENKKYEYVIIYDQNVKIENIETIELDPINSKYMGLYFEVNQKKVCVVNLSKNESYYGRNYKIKIPEQFLEIVSQNNRIHRNQLYEIWKRDPDVMMGTFQFEKYDKEFLYILQKDYYTQLFESTCVENKQYDYIFSKNPILYAKVLNASYVKHLPIYTIL